VPEFWGSILGKFQKKKPSAFFFTFTGTETVTIRSEKYHPRTKTSFAGTGAGAHKDWPEGRSHDRSIGVSSIQDTPIPDTHT